MFNFYSTSKKFLVKGLTFSFVLSLCSCGVGSKDEQRNQSKPDAQNNEMSNPYTIDDNNSSTEPVEKLFTMIVTSVKNEDTTDGEKMKLYYFSIPNDFEIPETENSETFEKILPLVKTYEIDTDSGLTLPPVLTDEMYDEETKRAYQQIDSLKNEYKEGRINNDQFDEEVWKIRTSTLLHPKYKVVMKAADDASWSDIIKALDILQINRVQRYSIEQLNWLDEEIIRHM